MRLPKLRQINRPVELTYSQFNFLFIFEKKYYLRKIVDKISHKFVYFPENNPIRKLLGKKKLIVVSS